MSANERVRLAQELHDGIAQDLVGLGYSIDSLVATSGTPNEIRAELRSLRFSISDLIDKVRHEIFDLRTHSISQVSPSSHNASQNYELERIFAELVRNVQAHSQATSLTMSVTDNGLGGASEKSNHHGLVGVAERVHGLGGAFEIESSELGTRICITVPLDLP